jgi:membrane associated rhomboid family serine protease
MRRLAAVGGIPAAQGGRVLAEALPLAGARRWKEALAVLDASPGGAALLLAIEATAAAETGDLRRALRACARLADRADAAVPHAGAVRAVLAAAGRTETLATAARARWPVLAGATPELLLGRAHEARGEGEAARGFYELAARRARRRALRDAQDGLERVDAGELRTATPDEVETDEILRLERWCRSQAETAAAAPRVRPWATWIVTAVTALISATVTLQVGSDGFGLLAAGALSAPLVAGEGQWWRLFTAMVLHGGWLHLVLNLGCVVPVGTLVERRLGAARTLLLYLGSGLAGSVASVYLNATDVGVGASGAAMGLIGALLALMWRRPGRFQAIERRRWTSLLWIGVVATAVIGVLEHRYVDNAAHGAGLVAGAALALAVLPVTQGVETRLRRAGARLGAALLVALLGAALLESRAESAAWSEMRIVRARGASVELPGWLLTRPVPDGTVVVARPPAEIALLLGSSESGPPRPEALFPASGPLRDLLVAADVPDTLPEGEHVVDPTAAALEAGLALEWESGVRFSVLRAGDAWVLVRLPGDPVIEKAYEPLLRRVRTTLRATGREMDDAAGSNE